MDFRPSSARPTCIVRPRASSGWTPDYLDNSEATWLETREMNAGLPTWRDLAEIVIREELHHVVPEFLSFAKLTVVA